MELKLEDLVIDGEMVIRFKNVIFSKNKQELKGLVSECETKEFDSNHNPLKRFVIEVVDENNKKIGYLSISDSSLRKDLFFISKHELLRGEEELKITLTELNINVKESRATFEYYVSTNDSEFECSGIDHELVPDTKGLIKDLKGEFFKIRPINQNSKVRKLS